jgi:hypothetical protein
MQKFTWDEINAGRKMSKAERRYRRLAVSLIVLSLAGMALTSSVHGQTVKKAVPNQKKPTGLLSNWIGETLPNSARTTFPVPGDKLYADAEEGRGWARKVAVITKALSRPDLDPNERRLLIERRNRIYGRIREEDRQQRLLIQQYHQVLSEMSAQGKRDNIELIMEIENRIYQGRRWVIAAATDLQSFKEVLRSVDESPDSDVLEENLGLDSGTALEFQEEGSVDTEIFRQSNISRSIHTTFWLKVRVLDGEHAGETVYVIKANTVRVDSPKFAQKTIEQRRTVLATKGKIKRDVQ